MPGPEGAPAFAKPETYEALEARPLDQPMVDESCFVGAVIVQHQVDTQVRGRRAVDLIEESLEFDGTMSRIGSG